MLFGIGTDIVENHRIADTWQRFGDRFAEQILSEEELSWFAETREPINFLAKAFAAKEAVVKAMGTGFKEGITHQDITIARKESGQPHVIFAATAKAFIESHLIANCHISISDEKNYTMAFVALELHHN